MNDSCMAHVIHFILASNTPNSITRIVAAYANALVRRGEHVIVSYPMISFWDYLVWLAGRRTNAYRGVRRVVMYGLVFLWHCGHTVIQSIRIARGIQWCGTRLHAVGPRVQLRRYWRVPTHHAMPNADVMVVMQDYLIPRLLFLPQEKGKIVGSIHMDYQAMVQDEGDPMSRDWWRQFLIIDQHLLVPRFAVSTAALESAKILGVSVDRVIENGVDLQEFYPRERTRDHRTPIRILLYCAVASPKGQDMGVKVVRTLRSMYPSEQVEFVSLGEVKKEHADEFDVNIGYVHGATYAAAYRNADIVIYPALRDGFPAPPLEALASGCALASTAVQGVTEYVVHGDNGLLSPPGDIDGMVANVRRLVSDATLRAELSIRAVKTARQFAWDTRAEKLVAFINDVVTRGVARVS